MNDEFYIGYRKTAPARTARFVCAAATVIVAGVVSTALTIGRSQQIPGDGTYDFGRVDVFEGTVLDQPYPHLAIISDDRARAALLVGQGKHGPPAFITDASGKRVRLGATRIERHGMMMLEAAGADSFEILGDAAFDPSTRETQGRSTVLTGELVDTKCYLGVMNPGRGKVHRGCAAECLRGGVPPALLVRTTDGGSHVVVLKPQNETVPNVDPEWAARTVRADGRLVDADGLVVLVYSRLDLSR